MSMSHDQSVDTCAWSGRELWEKAIAHTRTRSPSSFDQWFAGIQFDDLTDGVPLSARADEFVLGVGSRTIRPHLATTIRDMTGWSVQVAWSIDPIPPARCASAHRAVGASASHLDARPRCGSRLRPPRSTAPSRRPPTGHQPEVHLRELRRRPVEPARARGGDRGGRRRRAAATTRSSSAAARASARRTWCTPSRTASAPSAPARASSTSRPSGSRTSSSRPSSTTR